MNELDLLLKELDKASSRPKNSVPRSGSAKGPLSGMQRLDGGPDSRRPSALATGSSSSRPEGKELDGLVKDLTELKGLVGGKEPAPAARATRPIVKSDESHSRAAEATSQLDRLMGDLSMAVGDLESRGPSPDRPAPPANMHSMLHPAPANRDYDSTYANAHHNAADPHQRRPSAQRQSEATAPTPSSEATPLTTEGSSDETPRGPQGPRIQSHPDEEWAMKNEHQQRREESLPQDDEVIAQSASTIRISEGRSPEPPTPRSPNLHANRDASVNRNSFGASSPPPARAVPESDHSMSHDNGAPSAITPSTSGQNVNVRTGSQQTPPQPRGPTPLADSEAPPAQTSGTKICAACAGALSGPTRCITALGQHWHPHHFFCAQCGKLFPPGAGFLEKDGMAYCEDDYFNLFAMRCGGCGKGIIGEFVSACGKEWHMPCFVCADCKENFPTGVFYEHYGLPYCAKHHAIRRGNKNIDAPA
ncbi:hypothetical protein HDU86_005449 [Geranomyces michiganensis]|nr:hypothetical protein HDU86_005449 [Geranomyces michiganensis]